MMALLKLLMSLFKKDKPVRKIRKKEDRKTSIPREEIRKVAEPKVYEPKAKNDAHRIKMELLTLRRVNRPLYDMMHDLAQWIGEKFDQETIMTMIYRTQEEQDHLYRNSERYKKRKFKSPHQFYHAVDIRSRIFDDEQIKQIEDYLNNKYNESNYYKWTAKNHKITGGAYHFHIQYIKK
jgi:hypothetical protein